MAQQPDAGPWSSVLQLIRHGVFYWERLLAPCPTPNLADQLSVFITPGDGMAQQ